MTTPLREAVRRRARGRCEYYRLPDFAMSRPDFHVEHIIARKHGGKSTMENLAWSCIFCNLYKGPNLASFDPDTGRLTTLFNPRTEPWSDHFQMDASRILGLTPIGRTSVWLLEMNSEILANLRASLIAEGKW